MTGNKISDSTKGILFLLLAAFLYSLMPILIRTLGSGGIPPVSQVFLRYFFAFLAAFFYFRLTNRSVIHLQKRDFVPLAIATIFGYALTNVFFTIGILNTQISVTLFLSYTYAIIAPVVGFFLLKDKINKFNVAALVLSLLALLLLFQPSSLPTWKIGAFFAFLSAISQAAYVLMRRLLKNYSAGFLMLCNTLVGVLVVGLLSFVLENSFYSTGTIGSLSGRMWLVTILFGLDNFAAWLTMTKGFEYFKTSSASIILLSEIVFGVIFALAFFQEIPTFATILGGLLILVSSAAVILKGES